MNKIVTASIFSAICMIIFIVLSFINDRNSKVSILNLGTALLFETIFLILV